VGLWLAWTDDSKTWSTYKLSANDLSKDFFDTSMMVVMGEGLHCSGHIVGSMGAPLKLLILTFWLMLHSE
jgi:hypothetical protein